MAKQIFNPYLPFYEYVPDGEPHVFGDRVYVYGSHDREAGEQFCQLDYVVWSAPTDDLKSWRCEGVSYRAVQDPGYGTEGTVMYAPDVVQGNDGRYYLYYAMAGLGNFTAPMHVAVSDSPAGPFQYYGAVRNPDGSVFTKNLIFDPGLLNDNGRIWLYYGWSLNTDKMPLNREAPEFAEKLVYLQMQLFNKSEEEVRNTPGGVMGANAVELEDDMLTVKGAPRRIAPGQFDAMGTGFEDHAFFEASSMRKIGDTYYFIYSSHRMHELCYATSQYPDRDFVFGGTLISNGDIGINGRKSADRVAAIGNNHGSIVQIGGKWYVFYHRQTHGHAFSRQACAEEIQFTPDGHFIQAEMTSCGLNGGPLEAKGCYSAMIACQLTNGHMPMVESTPVFAQIPRLTNEGQTRFAADLENGTRVGFKYFQFTQPVSCSICYRGTARGQVHIRTDCAELGVLPVSPCAQWQTAAAVISAEGKQAIYLDLEGSGKLDLLEIRFD